MVNLVQKSFINVIVRVLGNVRLGWNEVELHVLLSIVSWIAVSFQLL